MADNYEHFYRIYLPDPFGGNGRNKTTTCPFCEKAKKFSFNVGDGTARCLDPQCGTNVNAISFLTQFHKAWLIATPNEYYTELEEARGIPAEIFKRARFAYDSYKERWLIPYFNPYSPHLSNLAFFIDHGEDAYKIFKMPNVQDKHPLSLYCPPQPGVNLKAKTARVIEGEWDTLAVWAMAIEAGDDKDYLHLGAPGAMIFPDSAKKWTAKQNKVELYYDYDPPGHTGMERTASILSGWGKEVKSVYWPDVEGAEEDETDCRDMYIADEEAYEKLKGALAPVAIKDEVEELSDGYVASIADISEVPTFEKYIDSYGSHLHLSDENRKAIAIINAIATCNYMPGEFLWAFLVGQAGCGKTTLIESYGGKNELYDFASRITAKSLVSGWRGGSGEEDPSVLVQMNGKVFFIKDFTVVLGMSKQERDEVFNLFRDVYDGTLKIPYGNGKVCSFPRLNFNLVAGVTDAIKNMNDSNMGERFLRVDYMGRETDDEAIIDAALSGFGQSSIRKQELTEATIGYVKTLMRHRWDIDNLPRISESSKKVIGNLAMYTAQIRTRTKTDRQKGLVYRPRPEVASRLGLQYAKLAFALEKVFFPFQKHGSVIDFSDRTLAHVAKTAYDSAEGFNQEIAMALTARPNLNRKHISGRISLDRTALHHAITEMKTLKILTTMSPSTGANGRPEELYSVSKKFQDKIDTVRKYINVHIPTPASPAE